MTAIRSVSPQLSPIFVGPRRPVAGPVAPLAAVARPAPQRSQLEGLAALQQFGGDRKQALQTLVASGARAENPKLPWFKNVLRLFAGDKSKTVNKAISQKQSLNTKVKVKNFHLKKLRLTTLDHQHGRTTEVRHIDFATRTPKGKKGEVKDIGQILAAGKVTRMVDQYVRKPKDGDKGTIDNKYFDPKTGQNFMQTHEVAQEIEKDKNGTYKSHKNKQTYREINLFDGEGRMDARFVFDYGGGSIRREVFDDQGKVVESTPLGKHTDYWKMVDELSLTPPSAG